MPSSPHTSSHVSGHHPATVRLAVGASGTQGLRALMAELPASGAHRAVELHGCCARASLAAALLSQHIDGVARAGSAGTGQERVARALLGPAHHVGARRREPHGSGINYSSRRRSELGNRRPLYGGQLSSPPSTVQRSAICQLPASSVSAVQLMPETMCSAPTAPVLRRYISEIRERYTRIHTDLMDIYLNLYRIQYIEKRAAGADRRGAEPLLPVTKRCPHPHPSRRKPMP